MKRRAFLKGYKTYQGERGSPEQWQAAFADRMGLDEAKKVLKKEDPYAVLGISRTSTWTEIKSAYRRLAREHHPDCGGTAEAFRRIQAAYEVLEHEVEH